MNCITTLISNWGTKIILTRSGTTVVRHWAFIEVKQRCNYGNGINNDSPRPCVKHMHHVVHHRFFIAHLSITYYLFYLRYYALRLAGKEGLKAHLCEDYKLDKLRVIFGLDSISHYMQVKVEDMNIFKIQQNSQSLPPCVRVRIIPTARQ